MLLTDHVSTVINEHFSAPAEKTRVIRELRLLLDGGRIDRRLLNLVCLQEALNLETDEVNRAIAELEQLAETSNSTIEALLGHGLMG